MIFHCNLFAGINYLGKISFRFAWLYLIWFSFDFIFFYVATIKFFHKNKLNLFFIYIIYYLLFGDWLIPRWVGFYFAGWFVYDAMMVWPFPWEFLVMSLAFIEQITYFHAFSFPRDATCISFSKLFCEVIISTQNPILWNSLVITKVNQLESHRF